MADNEKLIKEIEGSVKFKKNDGKLKLYTSRLIWVPKENGGKKFQCQYGDIKGQNEFLKLLGALL